MKRFNFLLAAIALVLTITVVGCTTMAGGQDDYYGQRVYGDRVYVDDPYRGTIVLERDPWTGRYYEVGGYSPYYSYGNRYYSRGYRTYGYGNTYRRNNSSRNYNGSNSNNKQYNNRSSEEYKKGKDEARNKVLGNH